MTSTDPPPVTRFRNRQRQGFVRVEVQIREEDAALIRAIATALCDPERESQTRAFLRERIVTPRSGGLKALIASAPLDGIDTDRPRDVGRDVSL